MTEREEFEAWCIQRWRGDRDALTLKPDGRYFEGNVNFAYDAWLAARRADEALMRDAVEALKYHAEQTRPILRTETTIAGLRARLEGAKT